MVSCLRKGRLCDISVLDQAAGPEYVLIRKCVSTVRSPNYKSMACAACVFRSHLSAHARIMIPKVPILFGDVEAYVRFRWNKCLESQRENRVGRYFRRSFRIA